MRAPAKYVQDPGILVHFYQETKHLGKSFLFICSKSGHKACHDKIEKSFEGSGDTTRIYEVFGGMSTLGEVERMRKIIRDKKIDVVVGLGGGSAIDTAKTAAYHENKAVTIVPTVAATDAPCTGLAVLYKDDHNFDSYIFFPKNPEAVVVDSEIIAGAPVRFLISGMGDALGTFYEARHCFKAKAPSLENGGILHSGMALAEKCRDLLYQNGYNAKIACENGLLTPAVEAIIEANIYLSGVGADNGGLAVAHSVYNGFTIIDENTAMHGEVVAFGTLVQLVIENAPKEELDQVYGFCVSVGLPVTLKEMGITTKAKVTAGAEKACAAGESIHNMIGDVTPTQLRDAIFEADLLGQGYLAAAKK
jgi:glycerol dehydrogenase